MKPVGLVFLRIAFRQKCWANCNSKIPSKLGSYRGTAFSHAVKLFYQWLQPLRTAVCDSERSPLWIVIPKRSEGSVFYGCDKFFMSPEGVIHQPTP
jgi:hypothetical protein